MRAPRVRARRELEGPRFFFGPLLLNDKFALYTHVTFALLLAPRLASAKVPLVYRAPSSCPPTDALVARLDSRVGPEALRTTHFALEVTEAEGAYAARLEWGDGAPRRFTGATCDEVLEAVTVIVALSYQTDAAREASAPVPAPPPPSDVPATPTPDVHTEPPWPARARFSSGAGGGTFIGLSDSPPLVLSAYFGRHITAEGKTAISLRFGVQWATGSVSYFTTNGTSASALSVEQVPFKLGAGTFDLTIDRHVARPLWVSAGMAGTVGIFMPHDPRRLTAYGIPWGTVGLLARARVRLLGRVYLEAEVAASRVVPKSSGINPWFSGNLLGTTLGLGVEI